MKLKYFSADFRKTFKYHIARKSLQWETSCSMRIDMTKLIDAFRSFANAPKNDKRYREWAGGMEYSSGIVSR
jgi:hypothetical protein